MKTRERFMAWLCFTLISTTAAAQCANPMTTISYDTVVTGSGNDSYVFSFPKFDPTLGTLISINITNKVTLKYSFQLENKELFSINNYKVRVVREDDISSDALLLPIVFTHQQTYGPYALAGKDGVTGSGPDFTSQGPLYVMNQTISSSIVYNTGDFMGLGSVQFYMDPITYSIVFGSANYNYNGMAVDTTDFNITYTYCPVWFLAANISSFNARKKDDTKIDIDWMTLNEESNRHYELQKSADGKSFSKVASFASNPGANQTGKYSFAYQVQATDKRKIIFRLKQVEQDGTLKYSALRIVDIKNEAGEQPQLYPNPTNGTSNLLFNNTTRGDWKVFVCNASGQVLQQYTANNALLLTLNTNHQLPKGIYFIRAINRKTDEEFVNRLVIL